MPAVENVWLNVWPFAIVLLPNDPSSAVTVCPALSWFVQVTVEPTATVCEAGLNAKPWMVTAVPAAAETAADGAGEAVPAAGGADDGAGEDPVEHAARVIAMASATAGRRCRDGNVG